MSDDRVLVIEPFAPHTFLAVRWAEALSAAGARVTLCTSAGTTPHDVEQSAIEPWSPMPLILAPALLRGRFNPLSRIAVLWRYAAHTAVVRSTLRALLLETHATHVVVTTTFTTDLPGLATLADHVRVLAVVHGEPLAGKTAQSAVRRFANASSSSHLIGCLTDAMRTPFIRAGAAPEKVILAPGSWTAYETQVGERAWDGPVTFVGEARQEKGFDFFAGAVPRLLQSGKVRVQTYSPQDGADSAESSILALTQIKDTALEVINRRVSEAEYREVIADSAMIALPYDPAAYPESRISQILSEAWAAGVPVVASRGLWASPIIERFGGGALFEYGNEDSLIRAVARVREQHASMRAGALAGHSAMLMEAGPDAFARFVLSL